MPERLCSGDSGRTEHINPYTHPGLYKPWFEWWIWFLWWPLWWCVCCWLLVVDWLTGWWTGWTWWTCPCPVCPGPRPCPPISANWCVLITCCWCCILLYGFQIDKSPARTPASVVIPLWVCLRVKKQVKVVSSRLKPGKKGLRFWY